MRSLEEARILAVDDEPANLDLLEAMLADEGWAAPERVEDARRALDRYLEVRPDLVLLDLHMPHLDGFGVLERLRAHTAADDYVPVLVLTADVNPEVRMRALASGARDFLTKPLDALEVPLRIRNLLQTRLLHQRQAEARARAEAGERRAAFLSEASRVLASSFDASAALATLARLAAARLADWCTVELREGKGEWRRVGAAHADPADEPLLRRLEGRRAGLFPVEHPVARALEEGRFVLAGDDAAELQLPEPGGNGDAEAAGRLRPRSLLAVPLTGTGAVLGALTLAATRPGRAFGADDLTLAEEVARRAAVALEGARLFHEAHAATRARDEILAVVAHDLRNPLNTVRMASQLLDDPTVDAPLRERSVSVLRRSVERMDRLIQDLLEVARLERGRLHLELRPQPVAPLLAEAAAALSPVAEQEGVRMETAACDESLWAEMDAARVLQVLSNLIGNAAKFTPEGGRIDLRCVPDDGEVRFSVSDTGPGIPPDKLPHVFRSFWQAHHGDRRGIGLGLAIASGIVEAHGGRIWVESAVGEGSTFHFTVPRAKPPG